MNYISAKHGLCIASLVAATTLGLQGCANTSQSRASDTLGKAGNADVTFPELDDAWRTGGTYPNLTDLGKIHQGLTKDQVYDLIGPPHFDEGLFNVHEWNYIFHMPKPEGGYMICQYQIHYDDDMRIKATYWRNTRCAELLNPSEPEPKHITLSGDMLFDFDSSALTPKGERVVAEIADNIVNEGYDELDVLIVGYTDRVGSYAYNQTLSEQRAATVRAGLIRHGVRATAIRARGASESNPVVHCEGEAVTPQLKACLHPNRRVEITIDGVQREDM